MMRDKYGHVIQLGQQVAYPVAMLSADGSGVTDGEIIEVRELVMPEQRGQPPMKLVKIRTELFIHIPADGPGIIPGIIVFREPAEKPTEVPPAEEKKLVEAT